MPRGEFDRSERRARTRAQLLDAAARVYGRRGLDGATLDEVAEEAGFTKGAVYDHFGSKEKLLFALLDEHLGAQIAEQIALFDPAVDSTERPRAGADRWMAELDADPDAFRLFVEAWVYAQRNEEVRANLLEGMNRWREMFTEFGRRREMEGDQEFPEAALFQVANVSLAIGIGLGILRLADPDGVPSELLGTTLATFLAEVERRAPVGP